ncbi:MAG TPA: tryptophan synthase subunit alpha [Polyangia bacterium]
MKRLDRVFARCRAENRKALVLYLTAGDPDLDTSRRLLLAAAAAGADIIEIGMPWSDPSADGLAIQGAMQRALAAGGGLSRSLEICRAVRAENDDVGLVLFGYANPVFVTGPERFAERASAAGADALLCVDWPPDEAPELRAALAKHELGFVPLLTPTSTPGRIAVAAAAARGFVYYVSMTGTTGVKLNDMESPRAHVAQIRAAMSGTSQPGAASPSAPIVVGFGITSPTDARAVAEFADGVVVGSAAVRVVEQAVTAGTDPAAALGSFVKSLAAALRR